MSCVHYKIFSRLGYKSITFSSHNISLGDLKHQIMAQEKLKVSRCDLKIYNEQTEEEYTDENALVPRNSLVIVRRVPTGGVKAARKPPVPSRAEPVSGTPKAIHDSSVPMTLAQLIKTADLAGADAPEEDKIKAMMIQSCQMYHPINYVKKPPPSNSRFHWRKPDEPTKSNPDDGGKSFGSVPRIKKSTGIPRSFLMEVEDPNTKGAMVTNTGKYVIPIINAEAYAREKKKKPPLFPAEPSSSSSTDPVAEEQPSLPPPPTPLVAVRTPAALGSPVQSQPASPSLRGPQGQSTPTAGHPKRGRRICSEGNGADWEPENKKSKLDELTNDVPEDLMVNEKIPEARRHSISRSKSPSSTSSHSTRPHTYPSSRPGSFCSRSHSGASRHCRPRPYSPSPPHPGRGKGKSHRSGSRPRSRHHPRPRSRSPLYRRDHSRPHTYSRSRPGSSCSRSHSGASRHCRPRPYSPSPPHPGRGKGKTHRSGSRPRSRHHPRPRSRSPLYRRDHSRPRSPIFRGHSPAQRTRP